jgi:MFS family permease
VVSSVLVIGAFMSIIHTTIVNVAPAALSRELHSSLQKIRWVMTGYLVALTLVGPMAGRGSDRFGAKRLRMLVVGLFIAGSALCGLAWSAGLLIFFRIVQGLGGGTIMPAGMTSVAQAAGPLGAAFTPDAAEQLTRTGLTFGPSRETVRNNEQRH